MRHVGETLAVGVLAGLFVVGPTAPITPSTVATTSPRATLAPSQPWEQTSAQEPNVWFSNGRYRMIYSGGWGTEALGYAVSKHPRGPWIKYAGNPIVGLGHGGEAGQVGRSNVFIDNDGQVYVYYSRGTAGDIGSPLVVATGELPDLSPRGIALAPTTAASSIENTSVVNDHGVYRMIFEARSMTGAQWQMGYATASSPLGPFTIRKFPLPSLQRSPGGMYGGPNLHRRGNSWLLLYHASHVDGTLPTDVYSATSTDLVHWVQGRRIVKHAPGRDQAADPYLLTHAGRTYVYWDAVNNPESSSFLASKRLRRY